MNWKQIGSLLVGFVVGSGIMYVYHPDTGVTTVCGCSDTGGKVRWYGECPDELKQEFQGGCP